MVQVRTYPDGDLPSPVIAGHHFDLVVNPDGRRRLVWPEEFIADVSQEERRFAAVARVSGKLAERDETRSHTLDEPIKSSLSV